MQSTIKKPTIPHSHFMATPTSVGHVGLRCGCVKFKSQPLITLNTHQQACNSQHSQLSYTRSQPKQLSLPETLYKVRVVFCKPVHAVRVRGGPHNLNHDSFTAKPSSHHVHVTLEVTPPTSPCPTLSGLKGRGRQVSPEESQHMMVGYQWTLWRLWTLSSF